MNKEPPSAASSRRASSEKDFASCRDTIGLISFRELLPRLVEAHEREIAALQAEISKRDSATETPFTVKLLRSATETANELPSLLSRPTSMTSAKTVAVNDMSVMLEVTSRASSKRPSLDVQPADPKPLDPIVPQPLPPGHMLSEQDELLEKRSTCSATSGHSGYKRVSIRGKSKEPAEDATILPLPQRLCRGSLCAGAFALRACWHDTPNHRFERRPCVTASNLESFGRGRCYAALAMKQQPLVKDSSSRLQRFVAHPSSLQRLVWDLISITFLAYDVITIPFLSAFDPGPMPFLLVMTWCTLVFWTLDMPASMLTGYQRGSHTIMAPRKTIYRYFTTWLPLDLLICCLDWSLVIIGDTDAQHSAARLGRTLRTLRFVRTLRLLRVVKMKRILLALQDRINSEASSILFGIMKLILCLFIGNHIVACAWYGIGSYGSHVSPSWIKAANMQDRSCMYQYFSSLHWSLTQFTPGSMEISPQNLSERMFAVGVLLVAMVAFSTFVSMLTASMHELKKLSSGETRQFWLLRRYLRDWSVRQDVAMRIQRYLEYTSQQQRRRVQEKDVVLLGMLSDALREELKYETFSQFISVHPLFFHCDQRTRVFGKALASVTLAKGDLIFTCGQEASKVFFLSGGMIEYILGKLTDLDASQTDFSVAFENQGELMDEGSWVAEAVLWMPWLHLGDLEAHTECQIITIDSASFVEAVQVNRLVWTAMRKYAGKFVNNMNRFSPEELTDLSQQLFSPLDSIDKDAFDGLTSHTEPEVRGTLARLASSLPLQLEGSMPWG